jgi:iron complex transport system ATP-binding protein
LIFDLQHCGKSFGHKQVLIDVNLTFPHPELVTIVGPNGAGKSTLLGTMSGVVPHYTGACFYEGKELQRWSRRDFAQQVAIVPQSVHIDFGFTVEQIILMGRMPFADGLFESPEDVQHVESAMEATNTEQFRKRDFRTLSGGEQQRVLLASAIAQTPKVLLLDEPTAYLDIEYQLLLYKLLQRLVADGVLVVAVTHDLNLAASYSDRIVVLRAGKLAADGSPAEVLRPELLLDVFRIHTRILEEPSGRRWIRYSE